MISRAATRCIGRLFCAVGLGLALGIGPACAAESAPDVDVQFVEHAPKILEHLRSKEFRNVGVLKFRVQKEGGGLTDNSGPLNLELAEKLELALLIATPLKNPLGIIHAASAVAAKTPGANHLTAAGRQELFSLPYVLAWGQGEVSADAFLTGDVVLSADRAEMNIKVFAFDAQSPALELVAQFDAGLDVGMLSDAGESFVLRGVPEVDRSGANPSDREQSDPGRANTDPSERASADAAECARRVRRQAEPFPLLDPAAPMELQILYDGHPQTIEVHHGKAFVSEPRRREEVTFAIKRRHQEDRTRYLAVLKINGENSIGRQRLSDFACTKWYVDHELILRGFQSNDNVAQAFRVMSRRESRANEMNYGADVGTIALVVYREMKPGEPFPGALIPLPEDAAILKHGALPAEPAANLDALKAQLQDMSTRGLIGAGRDIFFPTTPVRLDVNPIPVMSAVVTYYER